MDLFKKGLDGFTLKILALIFMTFDHISSFLWGGLDIPIWFNWIGRMSAPLFIFMMAQGFYHTRNRKKYIGRLYLWSVGMALGNQLMCSLFPHPNNAIIMNNIFATLVVIGIYLFAIECLKERKFLLGLSLMLLPIILTGVAFIALNSGSVSLLRVFMLFIPTILTVEGGPIWIALGIGCYVFRQNKKGLSVFYTILSLFSFA
ncbi:MAG: TraX family protein, partial [Cellulosilyticaceae bacterium]